MVSPHNLRPVLLPALLSNSAVREDALVTLASAASRDVCEVMYASERAGKSEKIMEALRANPRLLKAAAPATPQVETFPAPAQAVPPEPVSDSPAPPPGEQPAAQVPAAGPEPEGGPDVLAEIHPEVHVPGDVLGQGILAYLNEHAQEIASDGNKEFQPIGGFYDELVPSVDDILSSPASEAASPAGAAVKKSPVPARKPASAHEQERGSALQKISKLDIKGRIQLAMKGTKEERSLLVRDGTKVVALAVLESPKIADGEVEKIASQKNVLEAVLRAIPIKRRFAKNYAIVRNLVFNPRTPLDLSLTLIKNLLVSDLKNLSGNKEVSETVRKVALRMLKTKTEKK